MAAITTDNPLLNWLEANAERLNNYHPRDITPRHGYPKYFLWEGSPLVGDEVIIKAGADLRAIMERDFKRQHIPLETEIQQKKLLPTTYWMVGFGLGAENFGVPVEGIRKLSSEAQAEVLSLLIQFKIDLPEHAAAYAAKKAPNKETVPVIGFPIAADVVAAPAIRDNDKPSKSFGSSAGASLKWAGSATNRAAKAGLAKVWLTEEGKHPDFPSMSWTQIAQRHFRK